jgi:hypothetical protein
MDPPEAENRLEQVNKKAQNLGLIDQENGLNS